MPNYTNRYKTNQAADQQAAGLQLRKVELAEQTAADRENLSWQDLEFRQKKEAFDQRAKAADTWRQMQTKDQAAAALNILANIDPRDPDARLLAASAISRFPLAVGEEMVNKHYGLVIAGHEAANTAANEEALASGVDGRLPEFQIVDPKTGRWMGRDWRKYGEAITAAKTQKNAQAVAGMRALGDGTATVTVDAGDVKGVVSSKGASDQVAESAAILPVEEQKRILHSKNPQTAQEDIAVATRRDAEAKAAAAKEGTSAKRTSDAADIYAAIGAYKTKANADDNDPHVAKLMSLAKRLEEQAATPAPQQPTTGKTYPDSVQKHLDILNRLNPPTK